MFYSYIFKCTLCFTRIFNCTLCFTRIFKCTLCVTRIFNCTLCFTHIFNCTLFFTHIFKCTLCFTVSKPEQCLCCWQLCPFSSMAASFGKLSMPRLSQSCFLVSPKVTPDLTSYFCLNLFIHSITWPHSML